MKIAVLIVRILLGLAFLVFGLNGFFQFMPAPPIPGDAGALMAVMVTHGWIKFHALLYVIAGVLLLIGRYVPVALVLLGPILVNVVLFHLTLLPAGLGIALLFAAFEIFLIYAYWPAFRGIFTAKMDVG
jgi:putative oxidoreductase